ncbi:hypothetical protein PFISCL1PPCAC_21003, partial [Pristionchus fissidentatus]
NGVSTGTVDHYMSILRSSALMIFFVIYFSILHENAQEEGEEPVLQSRTPCPLSFPQLISLHILVVAAFAAAAVVLKIYSISDYRRTAAYLSVAPTIVCFS